MTSVPVSLRFGSRSGFSRRIYTGLMLAVALFCGARSLPAAAADDIETRCEKAVGSAKTHISTGSKKDTSSIVAPLQQCLAALTKSGGTNSPALAEPALYLGILLSMKPSKDAESEKQAKAAFSQALAANLTVQLPSGLDKNQAVKSNFDFAVLALSQVQQAVRNKPQPPVVVAPVIAQPAATPVVPVPVWKPGDPEVEVAPGEEIDVDGKTNRWVSRVRVRYQTGTLQQEGIAWLKADPKSYGTKWAGQIPEAGVRAPSVQYVVEILNEAGGVLVSSAPVVVKVKAPPAPPMPGPDVAVTQPPAATSSIPRFFLAFGAGTLAAVVPGGTPTDIAWFYRPTGDLYDRVRLSETGTLWGGVSASMEFGGFVTKHIGLSLAAQFQAYLPSNVQSAGLAQSLCTNDQGSPARCYTTAQKSDTGFTVLGRFRYQFRPAGIFQPYLFAEIGGGTWKAAQNIDPARPQRAGAYDPSSPYQLTDECSASFDGSSGRCTSATSGKLGYNAQNPALRNPPTALNVVCDPSGSCTDTVSLGNFLLGAGAGFYLGGKHVGVFAEARILGALRPELSTLVLSAQAGPQFRF